ncbi:MAG: hypothetical protein MJ178_09060 [Treponemataceae bacterium]|nr:hypothetical protein [Treponemataceae bacterium]
MNNDQIKDILLKLEETSIDFTVTMTGKSSDKVNGLYKPDTHEIFLHNENFKSDNQLIYTAIHEYTHHLITEQKIEMNGGLPLGGTSRAHTNEFWAKFHSLLEIAEQQGVYVIGLEDAPELAALTDDIRKNYLQRNGELMLEFAQKLSQAHQLCQDANIRYEDYIDRVLRLPRAAAKTIAKIGAATVQNAPIDPSMGYENMKTVAAIANPQKREQAQEQILAGKSPDTVRSMMKKKVEEEDVKSRLEKEKKRLEKTISQLTSRLEMVEESLSNL